MHVDGSRNYKTYKSTVEISQQHHQEEEGNAQKFERQTSTTSQHDEEEDQDQKFERQTSTTSQESQQHNYWTAFNNKNSKHPYTKNDKFYDIIFVIAEYIFHMHH